MRALADLATAALGLFLPLACPGCDAPMDEVRRGRLCDACEGRLVRLGGALCGRCGVPVPGEGLPECPSCRLQPPAFDRARAWGRYEGGLRDLIRRLKYPGRRDLAPPLAALLLDVAETELPLDRYDVVTPVPLHPDRLAERGFNQSGLLCRPVAASAGLPVHRDLVRVLPTGSQVGLPAEARRGNVAGAFALRRGAEGRMRGAAVLLVDDVVTTGATGSACAALLKEAGASRVDLISVARAEPRDPT
ncbi:ComF family protein [Myxococcota bacterium]|nr:ComF family protein [Myxococcota bacterium]